MTRIALPFAAAAMLAGLPAAAVANTGQLTIHKNSFWFDHHEHHFCPHKPPKHGPPPRDCKPPHPGKSPH